MNGYLKVGDLCDMLQVAKRTIYHWIRAGQFPPGVRIGKTRRWRADEVAAHIDKLNGREV